MLSTIESWRMGRGRRETGPSRIEPTEVLPNTLVHFNELSPIHRDSVLNSRCFFGMGVVPWRMAFCRRFRHSTPKTRTCGCDTRRTNGVPRTMHASHVEQGVYGVSVGGRRAGPSVPLESRHNYERKFNMATMRCESSKRAAYV